MVDSYAPDLLRSASSWKATQEAEAERAKQQAGRNRSPIEAGRGYVASIQQGENRFGDPVANIELTQLQDVKIREGGAPLAADSAIISIRLPKAPSANSEMGFTMRSANAADPSVDSILDLLGRWWEFAETGEYVNMRQQGDDGKWGDKKQLVLYYTTISFGQQGSSNGAKAPTAEADPAKLQQVLAYARGKTQKDFTAGILRDVDAAVSDPVLRDLCLHDKFVPWALEQGLLAERDGLLI